MTPVQLLMVKNKDFVSLKIFFPKGGRNLFIVFKSKN
jgi:hypothetical protein